MPDNHSSQLYKEMPSQLRCGSTMTPLPLCKSLLRCPTSLWVIIMHPAKNMLLILCNATSPMAQFSTS
jgi:hypothetical protein